MQLYANMACLFTIICTKSYEVCCQVPSMHCRRIDMSLGLKHVFHVKIGMKLKYFLPYSDVYGNETIPQTRKQNVGWDLILSIN